jgi:hypothetical protein
VPLHPVDRLAEAERHLEITQLVLECFHDLQVAEVQHAFPAFDDGDLRSEGGEHRGVLDPDHPGADDHHRRRDPVHLQDLVGVDDGPPVERHRLRSSGPRADRQDDARSAVTVRTLPSAAETATVCGSTNRPSPSSISTRLRASWARITFDLATDHVLGARGQVGDRDVVLEPVRRAVHLALVQPGEVEDRLAERLRRDRAGVDADTAHHVPLLDDGRALAEFGASDRRLLSTRTGTDDEQVVVVHRTPLPTCTSGHRLYRDISG